MVRHVVRITCLAMLSLPIACGSGDAAPRLPVEPLALPELVHLEPGAEVGQGPPGGWTHRVVRSVPRLVSGDLEALPESASATATRFRTVITAEVEPPGPRGRSARLIRVGVGNAVPVGDRELVITRLGPREAFETLGVVDRVVLIAAEAKLNRGRLIARSPTFALFQTPTVLVVEGRHREVDLHYALLVDPASGALTTLCWPKFGENPSPPDAILRLAPELSFDAQLDAQITRRIGPAPVSWSFAMTGPPPGDRIPLSDAEASALVTLKAVDRLEPLLRSLAEKPSSASQAPAHEHGPVRRK
ncbi:hypothetical protein [Tautonia marina]|uniref:hypothetical protein n=1 Tax=Tautonia marina TaxID=2653855 RepID=UPI001260FF13|nr:hypothetical protein [Tautonia marina]